MTDTIRTSSKIDAGSSDPGFSKGGREHFFLREHAIPVLIGLITVAVMTAIMMMFSKYFLRDHWIFIYLFPIAGIAMFYGSTPALVTSITTAIAAAYLLFPPVYSLRIDEPVQIVELLLFSMLAFIASKASSQLLR